MNNSRLVNTFYSLSATERTQLEKFVLSPFHNQHEKVTQLFYYLQNNTVDAAALTKQHMFTALFNNDDFNDLKLRHVCSYLQKVIDDYLAFKELQQDESRKKIFLLRAYRKRKALKSFDSARNATQKTLENAIVRDVDYHYRRYQLNLEKYNATDVRSPEIQPVLQNISDELDTFYIVNKLKQACNILSNQRMFNTDYSIGLLHEILEHTRSNQLLKIPAVAIYYHTYMILTDEGEEHFQTLKSLMASNYQTFRPEEMRDIYLLAINYCITRLNKGDEHYFREVFDIYKEGIDNEVLLENGELSPWTYKNITSAGLKLNETKWTADFIQQYQFKLPKRFRKSFHAYNQAKLHFANNNFAASAKLLNETRIKDLFTKIDAKVTLIKSYYELSKFELLEYQLDNFKQLLQRKEVLTYHKKNYSNFVRLTKKMINLKSFDGAVKSKLHRDIDKAEILTEREWLSQKLNEL